MFRNQPTVSIISNNTNELIGRRRHGRLIAAAKVDVDKHLTPTGIDPTGLDICNYIDIVKGNKNCVSYMHTNTRDQK